MCFLRELPVLDPVAAAFIDSVMSKQAFFVNLSEEKKQEYHIGCKIMLLGLPYPEEMAETVVNEISIKYALARNPLVEVLLQVIKELSA
jgi:hypothetical protein